MTANTPEPVRPLAHNVETVDYRDAFPWTTRGRTVVVREGALQAVYRPPFS
jgi:hypothetical protein